MGAHPSRVACFVLLATGTFARVAFAQDVDACIDANEKAIAQRKAEKLIDARASLSVCAASTCPDVIRASCQQRLAEVSQAIPSIVFSVKDPSGRDLALVRLSIDASKYTDRLEGHAIVVDPGEHEFRFEVEGQEPVVRRFVLPEGEQNRREEIVIGAPPAPVAAQREAAGRASAQRTVAFVVGGVGVAGLALGGIFGALSIGAHGSYEKNCGSNIGAPPGQCNATGVTGESDAATKGTISTIAFVGGGVMVAAGAVLFLTAPAHASSPEIGMGPGSVFLRGRF
jgi:hypothetical protein